ncbi:DUF5990 family protein [Kitasatospora sp. NBC_00070]|uniref:DUF5990 family protein n=1 Tax=Kitasatospora sp. NBC_00070 TaxID=2975962 RepID=UPI00324E156C
MQIRIEATDLPGLNCPAAPGFPGYANVHVAVQQRRQPAELLDPQPGDAASAGWTLDCRPSATGADLTGPQIQGGPGARFVYLSWGGLGADGTFTVFRRAKLMLDAVEPATLAAAVRSGVLLARLGLTDALGRPLCAAVRPPRITWSGGLS